MFGTYSRLHEDELSGSKHVDVTKIKNKKIKLENVHFVGLYGIVLYCIVFYYNAPLQKNIKNETC